MKTTPTFTEALALVIQYMQDERQNYEDNPTEPTGGDAQPSFHIWQAVETLQLHAPAILAACKAAWQLAYALGDQDTPESLDLFNLHMECDKALLSAGEVV